MFSYKSSTTNSSVVGLIQYLEALVTCKAIKALEESILPEQEGKAVLDINIKWPNDVYIDKSKKFVGIVCQSTYSSNAFDITSGIGINVSNNKPTTCLEKELEMKIGRTIQLPR